MVENKVTIITGAARGIGFEISRQFALNGAKVVLSDLNEEKVKEAAESLQRSGLDCLAVRADVTNEKELQI